MPIEWLETRKQIRLAEKQRTDTASSSRILLICGAARHDQTCPGEMSKTFRLVQMARQQIESVKGFECDLLDLSMCPIPDHHIVPSRSPLLLAREVFLELAGDRKSVDREVFAC